MSAVAPSSPAPSPPPRILLVGGVDPTGGAGLALDVRMAAALGAHPATVAACLTVQNRHGFTALHPVDVAVVRDSLRAVGDDGPVAAVKLGLLGTPELLECVIEFCVAAMPDVPVIVDPVLSATAGGLATGADLVAAYRAALPRVTVITPNLAELARLVAADGMRSGDADPAALLGLGCRFVLRKGGHGEPDADGCIEDHLVAREGEVIVRHPWLARGPVHGTGCALATALAARLAGGASVEAAFRGAVADLESSIGATPTSTDGLPVPLVVRPAPGS